MHTITPGGQSGKYRFTYKELRRFFALLTECAETYSFKMAPTEATSAYSPGAIIRHDIDVDLFAALRMAEVEAEFKINATFFFLTGCDTYNLASTSGRSALRELADKGFEVGLHFDPLLYPGSDDQALLAAVRREAGWIQDITGQPVHSVSLHNPSVHNQFPIFPGFLNAYDPAFFDPDFYMSDSCMQFRGKDPMTFVERARQRPVQILLHPFHYSDAGGGYPDLYRAFLARFADRIHATMQVNATYLDQMGDAQLLRIDP
jgi:hypothetical protein